MPNSILSSHNAVITALRRGAMTGIDPITRHRNFGVIPITLNVWVTGDHRPVTDVFPGADDYTEILKGRLVNPLDLPDGLGQDVVCEVAFVDGVIANGLFKPTIAFNRRAGNFAGRKEKGHPFYLLIKRI